VLSQRNKTVQIVVFYSAQEKRTYRFFKAAAPAQTTVFKRRAECTATKKSKDQDQDHSFFEVKPETVRVMCSRALLAGCPGSPELDRMRGPWVYIVLQLRFPGLARTVINYLTIHRIRV